MKPVRATVVERRTLCPALWQIRVATPDLARTVRPGQFYLAAGSGYLRHPLFPARLAASEFAFLVRADPDPFSAWLAARAPGDALDLMGPFGHGFDAPTSGQRLLLVAETALDVGPLLPLVDSSAADGAPATTLLTAATRAAGVFPLRELPPAVELRVATADGSLGQRGDVTTLLSDALPWADRVCAAGSRNLYRSLYRNLQTASAGLRHGLPMHGFVQVLLRDVPLVCGVGACLACAVQYEPGTRLACVEGPVFDLSDLAEELAA
jgi:dihydroorotate dehydrogenase electron transfer subunit